MLGAFVLLVIVWAAACAFELLKAVQDTRRGVAAVDAVQGQLSGSDLVAEKPLPDLVQARADFTSAHSRLSSPLLGPMKILPVLGRQVSSVQDLSQAAQTVTGVGENAIRQAHAILQLPHQAGPNRVLTLRRLSLLASTTLGSISGVDLGPSEALVGPLAQRRDKFSSQLTRVRNGLSHSASVTADVATILSGPQNYLLLAANNAEMRDGSGMFLEAGLLGASGGHIQLGVVQPTGNLYLPASQAPPISGDLAARWGWIQPNQEWRNLGVTPQFNVTAPLAAQMWQVATGQHVDGVIAVDIQALRDILTVTGPVDVAGQLVSADNVVTVLMHDQYAGLSNTPSDEANALRHDALGTLAHSAVNALENGNIDLSTLAKAMADASQGRHILVWSAQPSTEASFSAAGVGGELAPNDLMAAVINRGGNKLDQYLAVTANLQRIRQAHSTAATLSVRLQNEAPKTGPSYIEGPYPGLGTQPGEYVGILAVNLPAGSTDAHAEGYQTLAASGPEGPTLLLAAPIDIKLGQTLNVNVTFDLPNNYGAVNVVPTARVPPVNWNAGSSQFNDGAPHHLTW